MKFSRNNSVYLVEMTGFEPVTPCVQSRCSPAELHPRIQSSVVGRQELFLDFIFLLTSEV